jgi:hypothetical protein
LDCFRGGSCGRESNRRSVAIAVAGLLGIFAPFQYAGNTTSTNVIFGQITLVDKGEFPNSLGTLTSKISVDRGAWQEGPTPLPTGEPGKFSVDLSTIAGDYLVMNVHSDVPRTDYFTYATWLTSPPTVVWAEACYDLEDLKGARICTYTQYWVPRHALAYFLGRPYWNKVVPQGRPGPEALAPPPGILQVASNDYPGELD